MPTVPPLELLPWRDYLWVACGTMGVFLAAWPLLVRAHREAWVDAMWALSIPAVAIAGAGLTGGWGPRRFLAALLPTIWGARLGWHLLVRLGAHAEDGRYRAMREAFGARHTLAMGPFFLMQGLLAAGLALPWWVVASRAEPRWHPLEWAGVATWIVGLVGTAMADRQLARWRQNPAHRGRTCRFGLWSWSRHPNYFFEWLGWCGVALIAWPAPHGWIGTAAALLLLLLVTRVSGIPFTEQQALRSRGDDYRAYQREVSSFLPRPPRRASA